MSNLVRTHLGCGCEIELDLSYNWVDEIAYVDDIDIVEECEDCRQLRADAEETQTLRKENEQLRESLLDMMNLIQEHGSTT